MGKAAVLISGTDTGVGKTKIGCELARLLSGQGLRVAVMKPAETGCVVRGDELEPADALALRQASECRANLDTICPFRYSTPVAPAVAAQMEGRAEPSFDVIEECFQSLKAFHDIVLVEGAGGIAVPIAWGKDYADLAARLGSQLILVVGNRLGCLNSAVLSLSYAKNKGVPILGYVLNDIEAQPTPASLSNAASLSRLVSERCLGRVSYQGTLSQESVDKMLSVLGLR